MDSEQELAFPVTFNVLTRIRCGSLPALWKKNGTAFGRCFLQRLQQDTPLCSTKVNRKGCFCVSVFSISHQRNGVPSFLRLLRILWFFAGWEKRLQPRGAAKEKLNELNEIFQFFCECVSNSGKLFKLIVSNVRNCRTASCRSNSIRSF